VLSKCDLIGNGYIDLCEFLCATIDWKEYCSDEKVDQLFSLYDFEGNGNITKEEMISAMGQIQDED